ncbi:MAG: P-II family nitrogen regulator [Candidatus Omnitrophica bacterium]|nr:P-II family nitrogen regulator [Candidatus Omnitrophota bacterium]MCB9747869.1 P-II family nitrogen regulator [Candidatus Omnitrophota bacterium]
MKLITAIIQPDKLDEVKEALIKEDITRLTVSRVTGHGQKIEEDLYRGQEVGMDLSPKVRLEIACNDQFVDIICNTIINAARHDEGKLGDGKIFITSLEECIRIRTGQKGGEAI